VPVGPAPSYTQAFYEKSECPPDEIDNSEGLDEVEEPLVVVRHVATMQAAPLPTGKGSSMTSGITAVCILTILFPISTYVTMSRSPLQTNRHISNDG